MNKLELARSLLCKIEEHGHDEIDWEELNQYNDKVYELALELLLSTNPFKNSEHKELIDKGLIVLDARIIKND